MDYYELYRQRALMNGDSESNHRVINMTDNIERSFANDPSYRKAKINFTDKEVDVRFSENKASLFLKYFLFRPRDYEIAKDGTYLTIDEGTFILSESVMNSIYKKSEAYYCNQVLKAKGLKDMYCFADNTTYGVKGLKDNDYFKESDKKLKIIVQANNTTLKYYEGQRFLFGSQSAFTTSNDVKNEWVCYTITSKDFTVLKNQYVLELTKGVIEPSKDDLINGVAYNDLAVTDEGKENKPDVEDTKPEIIVKQSKIKASERLKVTINPKNAVLESASDRIKITHIKDNEYEMLGIKGKVMEYVDINLKENDKILLTKKILVY